MTTLLAIDTAADICSVAIARENSLYQRKSAGARKHAADVLPMVQSLLDQTCLTLKQLDAIVMVSGPGSFTGLRIGTAVAQGLSFGADIPIIRISSLMMLARAAFTASGQSPGTECAFYVCMHAREDEFYFAGYLDDGVAEPKVFIPDQISDATAIISCLKTSNNDSHLRFFCGNGWLQPILQDSGLGKEEGLGLTQLAGGADTLCDLGRYALANGMTESAESAIPVYLKDDMAYRKS